MRLSQMYRSATAPMVTVNDRQAAERLLKELMAFQRKLAPLRGVRILKGSNVWHFLDSAERYAQSTLDEIKALLEEQA